jgi:hypothetical protein
VRKGKRREHRKWDRMCLKKRRRINVYAGAFGRVQTRPSGDMTLLAEPFAMDQRECYLVQTPRMGQVWRLGAVRSDCGATADPRSVGPFKQ